MKYNYGFEKLDILKLSKSFIKTVYKTTGNFPKNEIFVITKKMSRATVSVFSNIAEGNGSYRSDRNFLQIWLYQYMLENIK